jgi:hypothetical protein
MKFQVNICFAVQRTVGNIGSSGRCFWGFELFGGGNLSLLRQVLDLGLAEYDVSVAVRVLVHVWIVYHEEDVFRFANGHSVNALDGFQSQF